MTYAARRFALVLLLQLPSCLPKVRLTDDETGASRECSSREDCPRAQSCCPLGFVGSCRSLEPRAVCPLPDLDVSIPENFLMQIEDRVFSADDIADRCALEKHCIGGLGPRRLLRFPTRIENQGSADLILGAPETTAGFTLAECDGKPYLADYLHYELLDPSSRVLAAEGHMQALCPASAPGFAARVECRLWRGFSETYATDGPDCQWIDITGVPPGAYVLRAGINPERTLMESDYHNDSVEHSVVLPSGDPLAPCPRPYDGLSGFGIDRDCGWSVAGFLVDGGVSAALGATCTPGQPVSVVCGACAGNPMLRVCDGSAVCSKERALDSGFVDSYDLFREHPCASVNFVCPSSGTYTTLAAPYEAEPLTIQDEGGYLAPLQCKLERTP
jgi:Lysyl oxidase